MVQFDLRCKLHFSINIVYKIRKGCSSAVVGLFYLSFLVLLSKLGIILMQSSTSYLRVTVVTTYTAEAFVACNMWAPAGEEKVLQGWLAIGH